MSATVYYEPHKLPAAILAVAVHAAFFALLYFGIAWQSQPGATMSVELWQSLPEESAAPPVAQQAKPVVEETVQPPQPQEAPKPEIVMPDKKKKVEPKPVLPRIIEKKPVVLGKIGNITAGGAGAAGGAASQRAAQATRQQAEKATVIGRVVDEYKARIIAKVRSNVVEPPGVADDARAVFAVTVLPGGSVLPPRLVTSSGNGAYDDAVERAILKSQPLPLPPDVAISSKFRELELVFRPEPKK